MNVLGSELAKSRKNFPFIYEIYPDDNRAGLSDFIDSCTSSDTIVVRYEAKNDEEFLFYFIKSIFDHYKEELPDSVKNYKKLGISAAKIGLYAMGLFMSGGAALMASFVGAAITAGEGYKAFTEKDDLEEKKEKFAKDILKIFVNENKNLSNPESLLLASIRLVYQLNAVNRFVVQIKDPENLSMFDIQFLRTYFNLFKDNSSRIRLMNESNEFIKSKNSLAESPILIILDWTKTDPTYFEKTIGESSEFRENMVLFRWFLRRYSLVDDLHGDVTVPVIKDNIFIGRQDVLDALQKDLQNLLETGEGQFRKIQGNSGMGKTSLANQFINSILSSTISVSTEIFSSNYSGENSTVRESLFEIRTALDQMKVQTDYSLQKRIKEWFINSSIETIEKVKFLNTGFIATCNIQSLMSPVLKLLNKDLGAVGSVIEAASAISDTKNILDAGRDLKLSADNFKLPQSTKTTAMKEIIDSLAKEFFKICDSCRKNSGKKLLWIIDDIQWMDIDSVQFFNRVLEDERFKASPILIIFLERPSDSITRMQDPDANETLSCFYKKFKNSTTQIDGFEKGDIVEILKACILNDTDSYERSGLFAKLMIEWFSKGNPGTKVEPLFVVETINLMSQQESPDNIFIEDIQSRHWGWENDSLSDLEKKIRATFLNWESKVSENISENGFTSATLAILSEKVYRLKMYFNDGTGEEVVKLIETGSFIGEPFAAPVAVEYIKHYGSSIPEDFVIPDVIENIYKIIIKYIDEAESDSTSSYLFFHSLYKEFMRLNFYRNTEDIKAAHKFVFQCICDIDDKYYSKSTNINLYHQAIEHARLSENRDTYERALYFALYLSFYFEEKNDLRRFLEYLEACSFFSEGIYGKRHMLTLEISLKIASTLTKLASYTSALSLINSGIGFCEADGNHELKIKYLLAKTDLYIASNEIYPAEQAIRDALTEIEGSKGKDSLTYKIALDNLAAVSKMKGDYDEACRIQLQLVDWCIKHLGEKNHETLIFMDNLSLTYIELGNNTEALKLSLEVYENADEVWGPESIHTLTNMSRLSAIYISLGEYLKALEICDKLESIPEDVLPEDHPLKHSILSNMALACRMTNDLQRAEEINLRLIEIKKAIYGEFHNETLLSINNLSNVYIDMGVPGKAESMQRMAVEYLEKNKKANTGDFVIYNKTLQEIYRRQGKFDEAIACHERFTRIYRNSKTFHHSFVKHLYSSAMLYVNLDKKDEAIKLLEESLNLMDMNVNKEDLKVDYNSSLFYLSNLYNEKKEYKKIIGLFEHFEQDVDSIIVDSFNLNFLLALQVSYYKLKDYDRTLIIAHRCIEYYAGLNITNSSLAMHYNFAGSAYLHIRDLERAEFYLQKSLKIYDTLLETDEIQNNAADLYKMNYEKLDNMISITELYMDRNQYLLAVRNQREVVKLADSILKEEDILRVYERQRLYWSYGKLDNYKRAFEVVKEAAELVTKFQYNDPQLRGTILGDYEGFLEETLK